MRLAFLGAGNGEVQGRADFSSALFDAGDQLFLIDAGAHVPQRMARLGLAVQDIRCVFITHMHGDHTASLPIVTDLLSSAVSIGEGGAKVLVPDERAAGALKALVACMQGEAAMRTDIVRAYRSGIIWRENGICVRALPNRHADKSYSLIFEAGGKRILFSGDLSRGFDELEERRERFDLAVVESAHADEEQMLKRLLALRPGRLILGHIPPGRERALDKFCRALPFPAQTARENLWYAL